MSQRSYRIFQPHSKIAHLKKFPVGKSLVKKKQKKTGESLNKFQNSLSKRTIFCQHLNTTQRPFIRSASTSKEWKQKHWRMKYDPLGTLLLHLGEFEDPDNDRYDAH